jgi:hypothetical protein
MDVETLHLRNCLGSVGLCNSVVPLPVDASSAVGRYLGHAPMLADGGMNVRMLSGVTLREVARISSGGSQVRIRFTNEFGLDPLTVSDAHVALSAGGTSIQTGSDHAITFGGATSVNVPPGAAIFSDPVALQVAPLSDVAVSFYLPPQIMRAETYHAFADQDNFVSMGDNSAAETLLQSTPMSSWYFFDGIDIAAEPGSRAIVTLGDSITDGALSTHNANHRWPDVLAARLQADPISKTLGSLMSASAAIASSTRLQAPVRSRASTAMCSRRAACATSSFLKASTISAVSPAPRPLGMESLRNS